MEMTISREAVVERERSSCRKAAVSFPRLMSVRLAGLGRDRKLESGIKSYKEGVISSNRRAAGRAILADILFHE